MLLDIDREKGGSSRTTAQMISAYATLARCVSIRHPDLP
jgi:hypothetical protein